MLDGFLHENYFVIVSEYADGGSLRDWLKENGGKAPTLEKAVEIMSGILDGLSHLHKQNIVHRDLKPENVLLKDDIPCIADFGVSRIIENTSLTNSQLGTNTAGSPMYMSPESFERIKPAPQIDIWSAGVMLFEMLSGKTPYSGETIPALIFEIVTKEPRDLPANIPDSFQRVVKKSLAKELDDRFSSAKEMREALMKALYTQDFIPTASDEDFVTTQRQGNNSAVAANSAATVVMASKPSTNTGKPGGSKKALAWAGIGATGLLAASLGIFTMSQMKKDNPKQNTNSVANQTCRPVELILVDDASGDDTLKIIHRLKEIHGDWIHIIELPVNVGAASARNAGWELATQTYIALLDSDDAWHSKKIEIQYGYMSDNSDVVLSGHLCRELSENTTNALSWSSELKSVRKITWAMLLLKNQFVTPTVMIKKDISFRFSEGKRHVDDHLLWLEIVWTNLLAVKLNIELAAIYKPMYGASGLSSNLWLMEKAELLNYQQLYRQKKLYLYQYIFLQCFSLIKFVRRFLIVHVVRRIK